MSHHRPAFLSHIYRWVLVLLLVPVLAAWGRAQYRSLSALEAWDEATDENEDTEKFLSEQSSETVPDSSVPLMSTAFYLGEKPLPPDYDQAQALIQRGLDISPLRSIFWLYGARYRLFQGHPEQARVALERSDTLHPFHTSRRLIAVELWDLLGERQRAIEIAKQVASTSSDSRRDAAERLVWIGLPPVEVFDMLKGEGLPADEMADLLEGVRTPNADSMRDLYRHIPKDLFADADFRQRMARLFSDPLLYEELNELWVKDTGAQHVGFPRGAEKPVMYLENPGLNVSPLNDKFYLGWQPPTKNERGEFTWGGSGNVSETLAAFGELRIRFVPLPLNKSDSFGWIMYRAPIAAHEEALSAVLWVRADPPGTSQVKLICVLGSQTIEGKTKKLDSAEWQFITVPLDPSPVPQMMQLRLYRGWTPTKPNQAFLSLRGLEIVPRIPEEGS